MGLENKSNLEYLKILKALVEIPFPVGKNLLADFLNGNTKNKSVKKNKLDGLNHFGSLLWSKDEIIREIARLIKNNFIGVEQSPYNKFARVLYLTQKGREELINPQLNNSLLKNRVDFKKTIITDEDRAVFNELGSFLKKYNDNQKKAIVSQAKKILCIAGAGSGKTTVLTKRIEFLVKYQNIPPQKILAITFTRKAKQEMERRLLLKGITGVAVHTFNSLGEKILKENEKAVYGKQMKVIGFSDKILAMNMAFAMIGISSEEAVERYFSKNQKRYKNQNQLFYSLMNDCFSVLDYFKASGTELYDFSVNADPKNKQNTRMIYQIVRYLKEHMETQGLRDYTDQIIDSIRFLEKNPEAVPFFEHVLVDEFQDVNASQIKLLDLLNPKNLFAVGDPRQAIFGWRGSDISYILDFEKKYPGCEIIHLTKNYRSSKKIVDFMNHSIKNMGLPNLEHHHEIESEIKILNFESEEQEHLFIANKLLNTKLPLNEIFILARTNRQLMELSQILKNYKIPHVVKTDEINRPVEESQRDLVLATIHAIKGLEARKVFVIGCNEQNFPCKASDHPAIEMIKHIDYDREEEERRLFYVAISRAKEILYLTYSGKKPTYFINEEMMKLSSV